MVDPLPPLGAMVDGARPCFLAAADWHVCRSAWSRRPIRGDADFALAQVVDLALAYGVPLVAAGDLFDAATPHVLDVAAVRAQVDRLAAAGLPLYYIQGQHERVVDLLAGPAAPAATWLGALSAWPVHLHDRTVTLGPFRVRGLDWTPEAALPAALTALADLDPAPDFLVCHQVWAEVSGGVGAAEAALAAVPPGIEVITGDYHGTKVVEISRADGTVDRALSPGALHRLTIAEPDEHHVWLVNDDGSAAAIRLRSRAALRFDLRDAADLDDFCRHAWPIARDLAARATLPPDLAVPLVRVAYDPALGDAAARVTAAVGAAGYLFLAPRAAAESDPATPAAPVPAVARGGLRAGLDAYDLEAAAARHGVAAARLRADLEFLLDEATPPAEAAAALVRAAVAAPPP